MNLIERLEPRLILAAGGLDPTFGAGGKVVTNFIGPTDDLARAIAVQADGKIIAVGQAHGGATRSTIARFNRDGSPDASFGSGGAAALDFGGVHSKAHDVVIDRAGRAIVGIIEDGLLMVARFSAVGRLDTSFAVGGHFTAIAAGTVADAASIVLQPSGKIVAGAGGRDFVLVRLTDDGSLDKTFGGNNTGYAITDVSSGGDDLLRAIEVRPDGRIVAGGTTRGARPWDRELDVALAQYTVDGRPDIRFAGSGRIAARIFTAGTSEISDIALTPEGHVLIAAYSGTEMAIARFRANGVLDRPFGARGRWSSTVAGQDAATGNMAVYGDGSVLLSAYVNSGYSADYPALLLARISAAGTDISDGGFSSRYAVAGLSPAASDGRAVSYPDVLLMPDGRILAAGSHERDMAVLRFNSNGELDESFGSGLGRVATVPILGPTSDTINAMALQPDGKVIVGGRSAASEGYGRGSAVLARYNRDGSLDRTFGDGGRTILDPPLGAIDVNGVVVLPSGKILALIDPTPTEATAPGAAVRINPDGSLDTTFGSGGLLQFNFVLQRIVALKDDAFIAAGSGSWRSSDPDYYLQMERYRADGAIDTRFGAAGTVDVAGWSGVVQIFPLADGRILFAGNYALDPVAGRFGIGTARLRADGSPDPTYGAGGKVVVEVGSFYGDTATSAALRPGGGVVVGGYARTGYSKFLAVAFTPAGAIDAGFGDHGHVSTEFPPSYGGDFGALTDYATNVIVTADDKIVLTGVAEVKVALEPQPGPIQGFALARYNPDGSPDYSLGDGGRVTTFFDTFSASTASALGPDGKLYLAGSTERGRTGSDFALARYLLADPNPVAARVVNGTLRITGSATRDTIRLRVLDGKLTISGVAQSFAFGAFSTIGIAGLGGDDLIDASAAGVPVNIDAGDGNDRVLGGAADDSLLGGAGDDTLFGGGGRDTLRGGDGNDYLNGGPGADQIFGEGGDDQIYCLDGLRDTADGGAGFDRAKADAGDVLHDSQGLLA